MTKIIRSNASKIRRICQESNISYLGMYGSYARDEASEDSDLDLVAEFNQPIDLIDLIQAQHRFEDALGKKVDLITKSGMSPKIKPYIKKDLQTIYETA